MVKSLEPYVNVNQILNIPIVKRIAMVGEELAKIRVIVSKMVVCLDLQKNQKIQNIRHLCKK